MKNNIDELSVEELAILIKQRVDEIKNDTSLKKINAIQENKEYANIIQKENRFYFYMKEIGKYLNKIGFYKIVNYIKINYRIYPSYYIYVMDDFNKYYDEKFINNAFNIILKREPSESERIYYLSRLRSGEFLKTEIITSLYFTKEAKLNNIKILGIKKRYIISLLFKIPFLGYLIKTIFIIVTLPKLLRRLNWFENYTIINKAEMQAVKSFESEVNRQLEQKAEMQAVKSFESEVNRQLEQKADKKDFEIADIPHYIITKAQDFLSIAYKNSAKITEIKNINDYDLYYSLFESVFYPHDIVIQKQKVYLAYIPKYNSHQNPHLDIGCGRGEFLQNLKENKKYSIGIDINQLEIDTLKSKGYDVAYGDMYDYLKTSQKSFSSISALQVIEHIDFDVLKSFLALAYEKLLPDGVLILETINPHNPITINSFYMDETHKRLIPPELLIFLLQWIGFNDIEVLYSFPLPPEFRSKNDSSRNYHDYAVIGFKR